MDDGETELGEHGVIDGEVAGPNSNFEARLRHHRRSIAQRMRDHIRAGTSDLADAPMRISPKVYTDPERFAVERERIFRETPLVACLSGDIENPGDFFTFDDSGAPILVVRSKDGAARAFLNICPHRGARLVRQEKGRAARFTCWFHGWTFTNDGRLLAAPEAERFGDELASCNHLTELPCGERHGFVFVLATPGAPLDLDAHLGTFDEQLAFLGVEGLVPLTSRLMVAQSNWKFILDTFYEGYHLASMHQKTLAPNYRNDIHVYYNYGHHFRFHNIDRANEKYLLSEDEEKWILDHRWLGSSYVFPNTYVTASPRPAQADKTGSFFMAVFRIFPGATVGETKIYLTLYGAPDAQNESYAEEISNTCDAMVHLLSKEDFQMAEEAWLGLTVAPASQTLLVGRQEKLVQDLERSIANTIGMPIG